jgi:nucleoside-diphosphate-sugar epimerase
VRSERGRQIVEGLGARPVIADALDPGAVLACVEQSRPAAIVHQLTAIPNETDLRDFDEAFAQTNALRTKGTDHLIAAARAVRARRFIAQSYCGWPYARTGGPVKDEGAALDPDPPKAFRRTLSALRHLETAVGSAADLSGVVLRYGALYGPGTALSREGIMVREIRRRRVPLVGRAGGIWSFVHVTDAASATVAALEGRATGTFNVVDDEPAAVADWLPTLARAVDAQAPWRVPALVARLALPEHLYLMMTQVRGGSNARFKENFDWQLRFSTWRDGFAHGLQ